MPPLLRVTGRRCGRDHTLPWAGEVRECGRCSLRHRGAREELVRGCGNVGEVGGLLEQVYRGQRQAVDTLIRVQDKIPVK